MTTIEISDRVVDRIHRRIRRLPPGLQEHCQRVEQIARDLAERHGQDVEAIGLTGLAHDATKHFSGLENLLRMEEYDLPPVTEFERPQSGQSSTVWWARSCSSARTAWGHPQLYNAIYWHTTGDPTGGDPISHIVFLADKLDPVKVKRYPWQGELMELAENDLPAAMTMFLTRNVVRMLDKGSLVHPASIEARNTLLLATTS